MVKMQKAELRKQLIQQRRSLSQAEWQQHSHLICDQLQRSTLFQQAQTVLSYCSINQEPDLSALLTSMDKTWGLPRTVEKSLIWHQWTPDGLSLQIGQFGILEPAPESPTIEAKQVDLLLVPCVGCDRRGYRLGYGAGFYDRLFSLPEWKDKPAIGIVFEFGLVEKLAIDPWDRSLFAICTEEQFIETGY
jgi:5-formyltetrahydrofolate cyclo-ligase